MNYRNMTAREVCMTIKQPVQPKISAIQKQELAAQVLAIINAKFVRPSHDDIRDVLRAAAAQLPILT